MLERNFRKLATPAIPIRLGPADRVQRGEAAGAVAKGVVRRCFAKASDDATAEKANGRTDVRPLGASLNEAHVFVFFAFFDFFVPITLVL
jgi:hypothetical protein